jgi:hypothetical protein
MSRLLIAGLAAVTLLCTFTGVADAANGECKYGQKADGTCWDSEAAPRRSHSLEGMSSRVS